MSTPEPVSAAPFQVLDKGAWTVIAFQTDQLMDSAALERISRALYPLVEQQGRRRLVMDFSSVKYLSSQAIGILLTLHKKVSAQPHGQMVLCGVDAKLMQLLKITRLDRLLHIAPSQQDALATPAT